MKGLACLRGRGPSMCAFFLFQAEDGIRDLTVTGVQTCALPISGRPCAHGSDAYIWSATGGVLMLRSLAVLALTGLLAGCGLAETGAAAAAGGVSKAEEVRQAKQTEARLQQQLDAANAQAQERRRAAEAASQ